MNKTLLTTLFAASTVISQGAAIHAGLLNYWSLDGNGADTAGAYAESTSTGADDVTAGGTAGAASIDGAGGLFGGSAVFDRTIGNDGRLAAANSADVNAAGESLTTSLWVQFDTEDAGWQALLGKGEGTNYRIAVENGGDGTNQYSAGYAGGTGDVWDDNGTNIQDGNWHHIVAITNNGGGVELYVNGALEASGAGPANIGNVNPTDGELFIGNNAGATNRMWDGRIDDVAQWERALTAQEVSLIYSSGLAGAPLESVIPEPSTGLLGALAGLLLIARRRR